LWVERRTAKRWRASILFNSRLTKTNLVVVSDKDKAREDLRTPALPWKDHEFSDYNETDKVTNTTAMPPYYVILGI